MDGPGWPSLYKAEFAELAVARCLTGATRKRRALEEASGPARPGGEVEAAETISTDLHQAFTCSPSQSIAAWAPPLPCGTPRAWSPTSMTLSVPRIIGALT